MINDYFKDVPANATSIKSLESGIRIFKIKASPNKAKKHKKQQGRKKIENLAELLFSEDINEESSVGYLPIEVDQKDIECIHLYYIQSLINIYDKLKKTYSKYVKILPQATIERLKEDKDLKFQVECPKLVITHEAPQIGNNIAMSRDEGGKGKPLMMQRVNSIIINKSKVSMEQPT